MDFAIRLVNSVLNLPEGQVVFILGNSKYRRTVINAAHPNIFWATLNTLEVVHTCNNLSKWQAVKPTFFAPWKSTGGRPYKCDWDARRKIQIELLMETNVGAAQA